jgi:hypothetical protein
LLRNTDDFANRPSEKAKSSAQNHRCHPEFCYAALAADRY